VILGSLNVSRKIDLPLEAHCRKSIFRLRKESNSSVYHLEGCPMNVFARSRTALRLGVVAVLACVYAGHATAQNVDLEPAYGSVTVKAGSLSGPFAKQVMAGGEIRTNLGGVKAWIAEAPDFKLYYTAGKGPLTISVDSRADTTLLINLPDGTWIADDDSGGDRNPLIRLREPQSGRYDIYVGTFNRGAARATLFIADGLSRASTGRAMGSDAPMPRPNVHWARGSYYTPTQLQRFTNWVHAQSHLSSQDQESMIRRAIESNRFQEQAHRDWIRQTFTNPFRQ
jgi:hypothetical protein